MNPRDMNHRNEDELFRAVVRSVEEFIQREGLLADQKVEPRTKPHLYRFSEEDLAFFDGLGVLVMPLPKGA